jgi:hypothetical protein
VRSIALVAIERTYSRTQRGGSNANGRFERRSSQHASHAVALAGLTIPSLPVMRCGSYLRSIAKCDVPHPLGMEMGMCLYVCLHPQ